MSKYKKIKDLREDNDLTQKEISEILHIHINTYANYERGDREITLDILILMAKYYQVSIDYIAGLTNNKRGLNNLNEEEKEVLENWNNLTERQKGRVEQLMIELNQNQEKNSEAVS